MDKLSPGRRSENMRRIRSGDTAPELMVRRLLHGNGFRFRLHRRDLPGRPDIVLPRFRVAIFVHGCFWHQHSGCREGRLPGTRLEYWGPKLRRNVERDEAAYSALAAAGWRVQVVWECETVDAEAVRTRLRAALLARGDEVGVSRRSSEER